MKRGRKTEEAREDFLQPRALRLEWEFGFLSPDDAARLSAMFADLWGAPQSRIVRQKWLVDKHPMDWTRIVQALDWVDMWLRRSRALPPRLLAELLAAHAKTERAKMTSRLERELMSFHGSVERHFRNVRVVNAVIEASADSALSSSANQRTTILTATTAFERAAAKLQMSPSAVKKIFYENQS